MVERKCPIEYTISVINGKWKIFILKELSGGPLRYGVLVRLVPKISPKVLIQQLRDLEDDGIIAREIFPEIPPRVEYSLTEKGLCLFETFSALRKWAIDVDDGGKVYCIGCKKCQPFRNKAV